MIYHINPEKRTVCCRMPARNDDTNYELWEEARDQAMTKLKRYVKGTVNKNCDWELDDLVNPIFRKRMAGVEYLGIAHCHPNDEFDVEKGKEVARTKALMDYYKDMELCMSDVADLFHTLHELASDKEEECYRFEERLAIRQENF